MERDWDEEIIFNHGTSNSRDVLIAFTKNFDKNILKYEMDKEGRIQVISFKHNDELFLVVS